MFLKGAIIDDLCYSPIGHVVTGDLNVIRDAKLRALIQKGPSYREQNDVDWKVTEKSYREAVAKYKHKRLRREKVDVRVLNEWECKVNKRVRKRIALMRNKHINRRRVHILKSKRHLKSLKEFHSKYVLVPADKAAQNVINPRRTFAASVTVLDMSVYVCVCVCVSVSLP